MSQIKEIDTEWIELIIEAKKMGLTIVEIKEFLRNKKKNSGEIIF